MSTISGLANFFSPEPIQEEKTSWTTCIATAVVIAGAVYFADRHGYIRYQNKDLATHIRENTPQVISDKFSNLRVLGNAKIAEISDRGFQNIASEYLALAQGYGSAALQSAQGYGNTALQRAQVFGSATLNSLAQKFNIQLTK